MSQGDFDRAASAIVELGNNFETTENEILTFSRRLAGAGNLIGLTQSEIFGMAAAVIIGGNKRGSGRYGVQSSLFRYGRSGANGQQRFGGVSVASWGVPAASLQGCSKPTHLLPYANLLTAWGG